MRTIARSIIGAALAATLVAGPAPAFASGCGDVEGNPSFETDSGQVGEECSKDPEPTPTPTPPPAEPKETPQPQPTPKPQPPAPKPPVTKEQPKPAPPAPRPEPQPPVAHRPDPQPPVIQERPDPQPPRTVVRQPHPRNATPPSKPSSSMDKVCVAEITLRVKGKDSISFKVRNERGDVIRRETVSGNSSEVVTIKLRGNGPWKFVVTAPGYRQVHREPACDCSGIATAENAVSGALADPQVGNSILGALPADGSGISGSTLLLGAGLIALVAAALFKFGRRKKTVTDEAAPLDATDA